MIRSMRKPFLLATLLMTCVHVFAATPDKQRINNVLESLRLAVNAHDYASLEPQLDEDFTYQGRNGRMSEMIMRQVVTGYPHIITGITVLSVSPATQGWDVTVRIETNDKPDQRQIIFSTDYGIIQADIADIAMAGHGQTTTSSAGSVGEDWPAITRVPFELVKKLIVVKAEVNGVYGNFLIDTGGQTCMLNSKQFAPGSIEVFEMNHALPSGAGGEILDAKATDNIEVSMGALKVKRARAIVADLSHMEKSIGVELVGVIGFEVLEQFQLHFDYAVQEVTFLALDNENLPLEEYPTSAPELVIDLKLDGHIPVFPVRIGSLDLMVGLDSGAAGQMIFTRFQDQLRGEYEFITRDEMRGADRNVQMGDVVRIPRMELGGVAYENMIFRFNDLASHDGRAVSYDGLLGYGFLKSRPTAINFRTRQLMVWADPEIEQKKL